LADIENLKLEKVENEYDSDTTLLYYDSDETIKYSDFEDQRVSESENNENDVFHNPDFNSRYPKRLRKQTKRFSEP
jgi:hypothetical protein